MHWLANLLSTTAREAVVFSAIGAAISILPVLLMAAPFVSAYGFVLLIEATALMIIGGAMDISTAGSARFTMRQVMLLLGRDSPGEDAYTPAEERKRAQFSAAKYTLTGVLLFLEALILAFALY
ncbi:MAG: hypothetical protein LYZ70_04650 [Nitrososphaerales archaeon]|nr:hypothetical protein [Nitrososphaerales archaeon]